MEQLPGVLKMPGSASARPATSQSDRRWEVQFPDYPPERPQLDYGLRPVSRDSLRSPASWSNRGQHRVTVARRIMPGQEIQSEGSPGAKLFLKQSYVGDPEPEVPVPETIAAGPTTRPRLDGSGSVLRHTLLGPPDAYVAERRARAEAAAAAGVLVADEDLPFLGGYSGLSQRGLTKQTLHSLEDATDQRIRKASAWLTKEEREAYRRQRLADRVSFYEDIQVRNERTMSELTGHKSLMEQQSDHPTKVLRWQESAAERELESQGVHVWQMGLRNAGEEMIRIGTVLNGLYVHKRLHSQSSMAQRLRERLVRTPAGAAAAAQVPQSPGAWGSQHLDSNSLQHRESPGPAHPGRGAGSGGAAAQTGGRDTADFRAESAPGGLRMAQSQSNFSRAPGASTALLPIPDSADSQETLAAGRPSTAAAALHGDMHGQDSMVYENPSLASDAPEVAVSLAPADLALACAPCEVRVEAVVIRNSGASAVHFTWRRVKDAERLALVADLPTRADAVLFRPVVVQGSVEPGAVLPVHFSFSSEVPGRFVEAFELLLSPDPRTSPLEARPTLRLRAAVAEPVNAASAARRRVNESLARSVAHQAVRDILSQEVLARIPAAPAAAKRGAGDQADAALVARAGAWVRANADHALFFDADAADDLRAVGAAVDPSVDFGGDLMAVHAALAGLDEPAAPFDVVGASLARRLDRIYHQTSMPPPRAHAAALAAAVYSSLCEAADDIAVRGQALRETHTGAFPQEERGQEPAGGEGEDGAEVQAAGGETAGAGADASAVRGHDSGTDLADPLPPLEPHEAGASTLGPDTDWVGLRRVDPREAALSHAVRAKGGAAGGAELKGAESLASNSFAKGKGGAYRSTAVVPDPFAPIPDARKRAAAAIASPWPAKLRPRAPGSGAYSTPAKAAYKQDLDNLVRTVLLEVADRISAQAPELSPLSGDMQPVMPTHWQQECEFASSWADAKSMAAAGYVEEMLLRQGLELMLTVKPLAVRGKQ